MSAKINDGGPAFPTPTPDSTDGRAYDGGMSLRDYFAGQALPKAVEFGASPESTAQRCYAIANAMIATRKASQ